MSWSNELTLEFLELYEMEPVIWDPRHSYHKNRKIVNDAWLRIKHSLGVDMPVMEIKKKKESLMASFRSHLSKLKESITSGAGTGDIYCPSWFAFNAMNSFLGPIYDYKDTLNSTETQQNSYMIEDEISNASFSDAAGETLEVAVSPRTITKAEPQEGESTLSEAAMYRKKKRHGTQFPRAVAWTQMDEVLGHLKRTKQNETEEKKDECSVFANLIAMKLRKLHYQRRERVMNQIHNMIYNEISAQRETTPLND